MNATATLATLTVPQLADRWQTKSAAVIALIRSGRLPAFLLQPNSRRPRYRVTMDAVRAYEAGTPKPEPAPVRHRQRREAAGREWF